MESFIDRLLGRIGYQSVPNDPNKKDDDYAAHLVEQVEELFNTLLPLFTDRNKASYSQKLEEVAYSFREIPIENCSNVLLLIKKINERLLSRDHLISFRLGLERAAEKSKSPERKSAIRVLKLCFPLLNEDSSVR